MAYTAEQKAAAVAVIERHGGMTSAAIDEVAALLGKRISTGSLHNWLSKAEASVELKTSAPKLKTEIETEKRIESADSPDDDIDPQHLAFVDAFFAERFNRTLAAIRAGYSPASAHVQGSRLLKNAKVAAEVKRRLNASALTREQVLANTSDMANASMADFLTIPGTWPYIDLLKAQERGKLHLLKKLKVRDDGTHEIELWDKQRPNHDMGQHHGLWKDGVEINVDLTLLVAVIDAIRAAHYEPSDIFNSLLTELHDAKRANDRPEDGPPG